jgi:spermidine/putrescine transport system substrate-binding protein
MADNDDTTRILIPRHTADRIAQSLSRRRFLGLAAGTAAGAAFLAACGSSGGGSSGGGGGGGSINLYTWAEYDDPDVINAWGKVTTDIYDSNEEAIQKLAAAKGSSGYDVVVPTGVYIPQMSQKGLLEELDLSRIPNFKNIDPLYTNQPWDPGNKYTVTKDWGSTGWIYDNTVITTPIKTWQDFIDAAMGPASGNMSMLDAPAYQTGVYFWANGIDWNTEKKEELDKAEDFMVNQFAKHIKAFDSYPGINLTQGNYALSQVWNGDARAGLLAVEEAGKDPSKYTWGLGAPKTELWMDNWTIVKGAKHLDAAYDFINYILDPDNSEKELAFHGYNTGVKGIEEKMADAKYKDLIFFSPEQVKTMQSQEINSAQDRQVDIYNKTKAAAGA